jgi:thioredoxin:protein disulfide reductase
VRSALLTAVALALAAATVAAQGRPRATVTPFVESDGVHAGASARVALTVTLPEGLHVQSDQPRDPNLIPTVLTIDAPAGVRVTSLVFPHPKDFKLEGQAEPLAVFDRDFVVGAELSLESGLPEGPLAIPARLRYQACDDKVCFQPRTETTEWTLRVVSPAAKVAPTAPEVFTRLSAGRKTDPPPATAAAATPVPTPRPAADESTALGKLEAFTVLGSTGGYLGRDEFLQFVRDAEAGVVSKGVFEGRGPLAILLIILLGGLALNLTPCVLPMIPINLAIIGAGAQAGSRGRGFLLGSAYGAAMAVVYGVLGLVVILTAGTFGTINASPWFNLGIAVLFIVLGLAMFDVLVIDFSRFSAGMGSQANRGTFALAFTMGAVAALLAGACVAPVVIQVVLFSSSLYAGGTSLALALPFVLGVGMAIPWPIAGAGLASLPKPGRWMVRVKEAFGVLIIGTALYYGYLAYTLFADRWVDASEVTSSVQEQLESGWTSSLATALDTAAREQKPVLIDFWATWCKNCLTMDKTTLKDPAVSAALNSYVRVKFQAEDPDTEPARSIMAKFNAIGLPTYVILKPKPTAPTGTQ